MEVMDFIRDTLSKVQEETGEIFNLEATPAEGTSYRLSMLDKRNSPKSYAPMRQIMARVLRPIIPIQASCRLIIPTIFTKR